MEIGITPYNEANAEFLYNIFGKEKVKVIEGQQAVTLDISDSNSDEAELYSASNVVTQETNEAFNNRSIILIVIACIAGAAIIIGGTVVSRKHRIASR